jgi:hypothetical protein
MRRTTLVAALVCGCGPASLSGEVGGDRVGGARDAIYDTLSLDFGGLGELELAFVFLTDFPEACDVIDAYSDAFEFDCEERCEEILSVSERYGLDAESYWSFSMTVNVTDGDEGEFDYEEDSQAIEDGEFGAAVFSAWDAVQLQDAAECEAACAEGELFAPSDTAGEDGTLELTGTEDDVMSGRFEVDLGGDEGVSGSFDARPCDTEDWIF